MFAIFQMIKNKVILYIKINTTNIIIGIVCLVIAIWLAVAPYGLESYYVNLLLQFLIPVLLVVPVIENVKPFYSREIGEIISGEFQNLLDSILFAEVQCVLYIGILTIIAKLKIDNTGDILLILLFQIFFLQGVGLVAFILSGTAYTGEMVPFLLQMILFFFAVEVQEYTDYGLIAETGCNIKEYFVQRWYYVLILMLEWGVIYLFCRNRFKFCKWLS